jgi:hypothetical protein
VVNAVKAVHMIESEAHLADLTQKVEAFLSGGVASSDASGPSGGEGQVTGTSGE